MCAFRPLPMCAHMRPCGCRLTNVSRNGHFGRIYVGVFVRGPCTRITGTDHSYPNVIRHEDVYRSHRGHRTLHKTEHHRSGTFLKKYRSWGPGVPPKSTGPRSPSFPRELVGPGWLAGSLFPSLCNNVCSTFRSCSVPKMAPDLLSTTFGPSDGY